jgi:hypothetical protein
VIARIDIAQEEMTALSKPYAASPGCSLVRRGLFKRKSLSLPAGRICPLTQRLSLSFVERGFLPDKNNATMRSG